MSKQNLKESTDNFIIRMKNGNSTERKRALRHYQKDLKVCVTYGMLSVWDYRRLLSASAQASM